VGKQKNEDEEKAYDEEIEEAQGTVSIKGEEKN
jgi:hypothetical protein